MSSTGGTGQVWERLRSLPDRTPLRIKMITAVLALVIIALAVISFTSRAVFGDYLMRQADHRLLSYYQSVKPLADAVLNNDGGRGQTSLFDSGSDRTWFLDSHGRALQVGGVNASPFGTQGPGPPPRVPTSQDWLTANAEKTVTVPGQGGDKWLVVTEQFRDVQVLNQSTGQATAQTVTLVVGTDLGDISHELRYLTEIDLLVSGAVIVILAFVGIAVVRASLQPLTDIEQTAAAIAAGDLSSRVPDRDPRTEVGRLGRSLNTMLAQIESAFDARTRSELAARGSEERMRQFVADASHELRTPLTAIRGYAEYYRQRGGLGEISGGPPRPALTNGGDTTQPETGVAPRPAPVGAAGNGPLEPGDMDRIMQRVEQESSRMGVLVEDMLLLARLDQQRQLEQRTVDMLTLAADAVHDARVVAPGRAITLTVGAGAAPLVIGDEVRLRQVVGNLMSNALNHTPDGTPIEVRVRSGSLDEWRQAAATAGRRALAAAGSNVAPFPAVILEVADHGPGLTPYQAEHVFERFYRADQARTRRAGGAGLGLAIVAALVAAHGGVVWVESPPGGGATFRVAIPLAPEARQTEPDPGDGGPGPDILDPHGSLGPAQGPHPDPRAPGPPARPSAWPPEPPPPPRPGWSLAHGSKRVSGGAGGSRG